MDIQNNFSIQNNLILNGLCLLFFFEELNFAINYFNHYYDYQFFQYLSLKIFIKFLLYSQFRKINFHFRVFLQKNFYWIYFIALN